MIEKTNEGYEFDTDNITKGNEMLIQKLPEWLTDHLTIQEIHVATLRNALNCYAYTLVNGTYT